MGTEIRDTEVYSLYVSLRDKEIVSVVEKFDVLIIKNTENAFFSILSYKQGFSFGLVNSEFCRPKKRNF